MRDNGKRLFAFTSAPLTDTSIYVGNRLGDELPFARSTAEYWENVDLFPVTGESISPIKAIRLILTICNEPSHAASNFFWLLDLMGKARKHGCRILLTGQLGNGGMSWGGDVFSQKIGFQLRQLGWKLWTKEAAKRCLPMSLLSAYRSLKRPKECRWETSAINPAFADRLDLLERLLSAPDSSLATKPRDPYEQRCHIIKPGRSFAGAVWTEIGAEYGMEVRDPTADARVLAFALSVPDRIFINPETGMDRWLIRESMKGRLPDKVRLNRNKGRQSADIVPRLRACAGEVEAALDELATGPAAAYVNVPQMRAVWTLIQTNDTQEAYYQAVTILTRGIMAGLWVNGFYNGS
jgi:asparagine synthase (glutamine-hydrolysing)